MIVKYIFLVFQHFVQLIIFLDRAREELEKRKGRGGRKREGE